MPSLFLCVLCAFCVQSLAQPNYPHKAASPPATIQPSAIDQLSMPQRRIINERAKDFYQFPDGATGAFIFADAYRLHRIRDLLAKATGSKEPWKQINITDAAKLGMGHFDNCNKDHIGQLGPSAPLADHRNGKDARRPTYKDIPDLITISSKLDPAIIICDHPHLGTQPLVPGNANGGAAPELEISQRCLTTIPHKVTIVQILDENNALAKMNYYKNTEPPGGIPKEGFHITGPTTGMHDGQVYPGDFILIPQGTEHYKNFAGVRATTASYKLIPLNTPITPEALAEAVRDGKVTINNYTITTKSGGYEWKASPIKFIFKP